MEWIFDADSFTPRDQCGAWSPRMAFLYRLANLSIAISYFAIPAWIWVLYRAKRQDIPHAWFLIVFLSFIVSCGVGHLCQCLAFYWPAYRLFTAIDGVTAAVSLATVVCIPFVARGIMDFPSWSEFAKKVEELQVERKVTHSLIAERDSLIEVLRERDAQKDREIAERDARIREMRHEMRDMENPTAVHKEIIRQLQAKLEAIRKIGKTET